MLAAPPSAIPPEAAIEVVERAARRLRTREPALTEELAAVVACIEKMQTVQEAVAEANANMAQLYVELEEARDEVASTNRTIAGMLDALDEGIVTLDEDLRLGPQISQAATTLLEGAAPSGHIEPLFLQRSTLTEDQRARISRMVPMFVGVDAFFFAANRHALPRETTLATPQGPRVVELQWSPIVEEDETVGSVLLSIRDVTELRAIQAQMDEQNALLSILGEILAVEEESFRATMAEILRLTELMPSRVGKPWLDPSETRIQVLFREVHTVKGLARMHRLSGLVEAAHLAEDQFAAIRKGDAEWDDAVVSEAIHSVHVAAEAYVDAAEQYLNRNIRAAANVSESEQLLSEIEDEIASILDDAEDGTPALTRIQRRLADRHTRAASDVIEAVSQALPSWAEEDGVAVPTLEIVGRGLTMPRGVATTLRSALVHVLRNSLCHGLESVEERLAVGKTPRGRIRLCASKARTGEVRVAVRDDGRGLDLETLRTRGIAKGLVGRDATDDEVASLCLVSGVTTRTTVGQGAGRGVGLAAVARLCQRSGGELEVTLGDERSNEGRRSVTFTLHLGLVDPS